MKRLFLPLMLLLIVSVATTASACEKCRGSGDRRMCVSGEPNGWQWCYGGFGEPCTGGGTCVEPVSVPVVPPADEVCTGGLLGCGGEVSPAGFVLDKPSEVPVPIADKTT